MSKPTGTVQLHRILKAPVERVYRAFTDKNALEYWSPPYGFTGTIHHIDVREGGGYNMSFNNFTTGSSHSFTVKYIEIVPNQRIRHTDSFDSGPMAEKMDVLVTFKPVACGTELKIVQAGIPAEIPVEFCYAGWQESLAQLAHLVEPDVPDFPEE